MAQRATLVATLTEEADLAPAALAALAGSADWLELRADLVGDRDPASLRAHFPGGLIYTLRSRVEGGAFDGARERRKRRILDGGRGFDLVDLEGDRDLLPELLDEIAAERRLLSWHGAAPGLDSLRGRLATLSATPARLYKMVPTAAQPGEDLQVLAFLAQRARPDLVAFGGGEGGFWTRLPAARLGAPWIYGAAGSTPAAPGQLPVARLIADYGLPELPPVSFLAGVAGFPALQSLSPRLHNGLYRELGLPGLYVPFHTPAFGELWIEVVEPGLLASLGLPLLGLSVTTPHKEIALAVAGAASPLSQAIDAANTLVLRDGVWEAESTDAYGVVEALRARGVDPRGRRAAVVGCGGAGRAAALGLAQAGARVALVNRGEEKGQRAAALLRLPFVPLAELDPQRFDLVVHATPLGRAEVDEHPLPIERLAAGTVVVDLLYEGTEPTRWVAAARQRGLVAVAGLEVLLHQARPQFLAMTGRELPVELGERLLGLAERGA